MSDALEFARMIGERVCHARLAADLSQAELAEKLGFNDRQTVSTIESGKRAVSAEELVKLAGVLRQPLDFFTDPYVVTEKHAFSYRAKPGAAKAVPAFEEQVTRLIATQRRFRELLGETRSPIQAQISSLAKQSPLDFATFLGEKTARAWNLGDVPAVNLRAAIERELCATILYVDAPDSISGVACRMTDGDFIFINRNEPLSRQSFDLGHELFHLLTWEKMPPERLDVPGTRTPVERLADSFTAGLLMPVEAVKTRWAKRGATMSLDAWLRQHAAELRVSPAALYWRAVNMDLLAKDALEAKALGRIAEPAAESRPNLYSADFVSRLHQVLERGHVSVLKAAALLDCSMDDLKALFASYKLNAPFAL
jgi:Zn-dependent peptidase ImmA (M78 family)/transcriptional regulator with XRE-family HTH domain